MVLCKPRPFENKLPKYNFNPNCTTGKITHARLPSDHHLLS